MSSVNAIANRAHPLWLAYLLHRISGLCLALFLPVHFWVLAMSVSNPAKIDGLLYMNTSAIKTVCEIGLVFLLAVHLFGGLRLLALEWLPWSASQKTLAAAALACSFLVSVMFFLQMV
jgi:fumarate reductase subunit D